MNKIWKKLKDTPKGIDGKIMGKEYNMASRC